MEQFCKFADSELSDIKDLQLLIIKGHIIVEYTLNCYLEAISKSEDSDFFKDDFSFADKIKIAKHFGQLGGEKDNLIKELILLNKLRNDIAHSLSYNKKHLDELFHEISKKSQDSIYLNIKISDFNKFNAALSFITGAIFAAYKYHTDIKDVDEFISKFEK